jgi:hypothetical protein
VFISLGALFFKTFHFMFLGDQQRFPIFLNTDAANGSAPLGFVQ